jgi:hypothetical protein
MRLPGVVRERKPTNAPRRTYMDYNKPMCQGCADEISWRMERVSRNRFNKSLCVLCQITEIKRTYPPKLAEESIKNLKKYAGFGKNESPEA